jgi:hypothetical protein
MSFYLKMIESAVPGRTQEEYRAIEEIMRADIFHSTLDWQTKAQFNHGAREAAALLQTYREMGLVK